jgi:hypothetical protein
MMNLRLRDRRYIFPDARCRIDDAVYSDDGSRLWLLEKGSLKFGLAIMLINFQNIYGYSRDFFI